MTIKGPYLLAGNYVVRGDAGEILTQSVIRNIYNQRTRRLYLPDSATPIEIVWFTDEGATTHHSFTVQTETTYYRRAKKNAPEAKTIVQEVLYYDSGQYGNNLTPNMEQIVSFESINKYLWRLYLQQKTITEVVGDDGSTETINVPSLSVKSDDDVSASDGWSYSNSNFDFVSMKVAITPGGQYGEFAATDTLSIEARPPWYIAAARYLDLYTLEIDVTSDFARTDDRWALEGTSYVVNNELSLLRDEEPWGMIEGVRDKSSEATDGSYTHVIYVDTTYFARVLGGRSCVFNMHFNHLWNDANESTVSASDKVTVETDGTVPKPRLTGAVDNGTVTIQFNESTSANDIGDNDPQYIIVALDGAKFKEDIQLVTLDENYKGKAVFPYPPLDKYITFEAVGIFVDSEGTAHTSEVMTYSLAIESHGNVLLDSISTGNRCMIKYHSSGSDMGPSISVKNDAVSEQLAGRRRPSVFYGESGTTDISFDGILVDDEGDDFEELPESGLCVLRFPGGRRYAADLSVSISDSGNRLTSVSVSGSEVDF